MPELKEITLTNDSGIELQVLNFGATITSLKIPNKQGTKTNVVVGLKSPGHYIDQNYLNKNIYLGSVIGRYAGRISGGKFTVDGNDFPIWNENGVHLHGGRYGFDKKYWTIEDIKHGENSIVTLSYLSRNLEEGYPGNLYVTATYELLKSNSFRILYRAKTDKATPVNITNHSYFNLNGFGSILDHELQIRSHQYLEVDDNLIPTGNILESENTRFDFNKSSKIGSDNFKGIDDTFILHTKDKRVATLFSEESGIQMDVLTNQPAMVVFTHPKFPGLPLNEGITYQEFPSICFETQNYPDAPNNPDFPNSILNPGEIYTNETIFAFTTKA